MVQNPGGTVSDLGKSEFCIVSLSGLGKVAKTAVFVTPHVGGQVHNEVVQVPLHETKLGDTVRSRTHEIDGRVFMRQQGGPVETIAPHDPLLRLYRTWAVLCSE